MIESETVEKMRAVYNGVHPLAFHRSVERAEDAFELFEILSSFPVEYPVVWDDTVRRWVNTDDLSLANRFSVDLTQRKKNI